MFDFSNMSPQQRMMLSLGGNLGAAAGPSPAPIGLAGRLGPAMLGFGNDFDRQIQMRLEKKVKEKVLEEAELKIKEMKRLQKLREDLMGIHEKSMQSGLGGLPAPYSPTGAYSPVENAQPPLGGGGMPMPGGMPGSGGKPTLMELIQLESYYNLIGVPEEANRYKSIREAMFPDPNKPFYRDVTGQQVPNKDYQQYASRNAELSAGNVSLMAPQIMRDNEGRTVMVQPATKPNAQPQITPLPGLSVDKPLTEGQGTAALYADRAFAANETLSNLEPTRENEKGKYNITGLAAKQGVEDWWIVGEPLSAAGNVMLSDEQQKVDQAQRDFINAILRKESGAVINPSEFENAAKQYFPQPGDSIAVREQKRRNREIAIAGLRRMSGPAAIGAPPIGGASAPAVPETPNSGAVRRTITEQELKELEMLRKQQGAR